MWRDGTLLVFRKGEVFPDRCVKTNRPARGCRVAQAADWHSPIFYLLHFLGVLGHLMAGTANQHVEFEVGLSDEWRRKRRRAFWIAGGVFVVSLATMTCGSMLLMQGAAAGIWPFCLGLLSTVGGLLYGLNASTLVTAKRISHDYVWLKGVHPDFLAGLSEWPGEIAAGGPAAW